MPAEDLSLSFVPTVMLHGNVSDTAVVSDEIDGAEGRYAIVICTSGTAGAAVTTLTPQSSNTSGSGFVTVSSLTEITFDDEPWEEGNKSQNESRTKCWFIDFSVLGVRYFRVSAIAEALSTFNISIKAVQWGEDVVANNGLPAGNIEKLLVGS